MRTTTIQELGSKLPIGEVADGVLQKEFTLRPYKGRVDRHLAVWREANEGKNMAHLAAKYLSLIVAAAGRSAFDLTADGNSTADQEYKIGDWYFADAMYAYVYSRIVNISEWIEIPFMCPKCKTQGMMKADLRTTEVRVLESPAELVVMVDLQDGFKLASTGKLARRLKLNPVRFRAMLLPGQAQAEVGSLTYTQLRESIVEVDGAPVGTVLTDTELDELTKRDLLRIDRQTTIVAAGVDLRTTVTCPKEACGFKVRDAMNWAFDPFFDTSVPLSALTL